MLTTFLFSVKKIRKRKKKKEIQRSLKCHVKSHLTKHLKMSSIRQNKSGPHINIFSYNPAVVAEWVRACVKFK